MTRMNGTGVLLSWVLVLFAYSSAVADTPVFKSNDGKWYGSINLGLTILNDLDFDLAGQTRNGFTGTGTGTGSFDTAVSYGGAIGYVISDFVRTENTSVSCTNNRVVVTDNRSVACAENRCGVCTVQTSQTTNLLLVQTTDLLLGQTTHSY